MRRMTVCRIASKHSFGVPRKKGEICRLVPQISTFALQPMLERLEHSFALTAQAKGLHLRVRSSPMWVASDAVLLERILSNLISNAVRYTCVGGVLISVRQRRADPGNVTIEVWDTGVGIEPTEQQHIFEEFYRLPGDGTDAVKGLGLGLAIAERLGRLLDAPVSLASQVGRGSKFMVRVKLAEAISVPPLAALPAAPAIRLEGMRVLLIDDAPQAREAATGLLTQWGCVVTAAASGPEAIVLCKAQPLSLALIICDYHLGETELGTDVIRQIQELYGVPIAAVLVSGDVTPALQEQALASGLHLLYKPLRATRLSRRRSRFRLLIKTCYPGESICRF